MLTSLLILTLAQPAGLESKVLWEKVSSEDGLTLDRRSVEGSSSLEFRVTALTATPLDVMCDAIFEFATRDKAVAGLLSRKELSTAPDERVIYDQFSQRMVSNRDYAITVHRWSELPDSCRIRFWATNEKAPKLPDGWVRLDKLYGGWTFTPVNGKTQVVYTVFVDPGGSVPSIFANGSQRETAKDTVRRALEKGKAWKQ